MSASPNLVVRPLPQSHVEDRYDLGFFVVGTEARSRCIPSKLQPNTQRIVAFRYPLRQVSTYVENSRWAKTADCEFVELREYIIDADREIFDAIRIRLQETIATRGRVSVWVDVSSMDKSLLARVLLSFQEVCSNIENEILLRLLYCPAIFEKPTYNFQPIRLIAPAIPELSGSVSLWGRNSSLIIGLGYEYGVALGIMQQTEPDHSFAFVPESPDADYDSAIQRANMEFDFGLESVSPVKYLVDNPAALFERLFILTSDASRHRRYIIVPNGPKIFAACSVLVALQRRPWMPVLRVSLAPLRGYAAAEGSDSIVGMEVAFTTR